MFKSQKILLISGAVLTVAMTSYVCLAKPETTQNVNVAKETVLQTEVIETESETVLETEVEKKSKKESETVESKETTADKTNVASSEAKSETKKTETQITTNKSESQQAASDKKPSSTTNTVTSSKPSSSNSSNATSGSTSNASSSGSNNSNNPSSSNQTSNTQKPSVEKPQQPQTEAPKPEPTIKETESVHEHNWEPVTEMQDQGWYTPHYDVSWVFVCNGCKTEFPTADDYYLHGDAEMWNGNVTCGAYTEHPVYTENGQDWVENLVEVTVGYKCSCGATK